MAMRVGKWLIKRRKAPLGGELPTLILHFGVTEMILVLAMVVSIFMQFRRKLLSVVNKLFGAVDSVDCYGQSCGQFSFPTLAFSLTAIGLIVLLSLTFWKSRSFRHFFLHFVVLPFGLFATFFLWEAFFALGWNPWLFIALFVAKVWALSCYFKVDVIPDPQRSTAGGLLGDPQHEITKEDSIWDGTFLVSAWFGGAVLLGYIWAVVLFVEPLSKHEEPKVACEV